MSSSALASFTGLVAAVLVFVYITVEAPLSGMSMNPARTAASAFAAGRWRSAWVYFAAPLLGMLLAGEAFALTSGRGHGCAKLQHALPCIFCHGAPGRTVDGGAPAR